MVDPVSDLLTRIRNALSAKQDKVDVPNSKLKEAVVGVLKEHGYIKNFRVVRDNRQGVMRIYLKYDEVGDSVVSKLQRESKPGRRRYIKFDEIPKVRSGFGLAILSTNRGVLSGRQAKAEKVGGEYLCSIW